MEGGEITHVELRRYANISGIIGAVVSGKLATLHELETVYSLEDAHTLLEIIEIDAANRRAINQHEADQWATPQ